MRIYKLVFGLI